MTIARTNSRTVETLSWIVLGFLFLPALIVVPTSFTSTRYLSLPTDGFSLRHWQAFFASAQWRDGIVTSIGIGLAATAIAVIAGTACAIGLWQARSRLNPYIRGLIMLPLIVPSVVYAIGLYRFYVDLALIGSFTGVIIAHAVTALPYVLIAVAASLSQFDARLEQAARNLGATRSQVIRLVILPNITTGIVSGAIFAFIHSWDELVVVLFVGTQLVRTLPRLMWDALADNLDPVIAVVATVLILVTFSLFVFEIALRRWRAGAA